MAAFYDEQGQVQQVEVSLDLVREASDNGMSVRDWVNTIYPTDANAYGDAFTQFCASEGLVLRTTKKAGLRAPSLQSVLDGKPKMEATGAVVRNPSQQARVLLMPAIGALIEDKLTGDMDMHASAFDSMIALDDTIADEWLLWPEANFSKPEQGRSQVTSQLARPARMLTLTTSEKQVRIPTYALGIEWSEQATRYLNLDFVALSIARQIAVERNERAQQDLLSMLNGDIDMGQASLASLSKVKTAVSLDAAATSGLTQKAWMLWLYSGTARRRVTHVVTDILGAMAIEGRTGRPVASTLDTSGSQINANASVLNPTWGDVQVFITDDPNWPAKTIMGIDREYAIQRVTSTNATYQATEDFVLRRGSAMRWDTGSICRRLYIEAFECLTYA
jgi:hypothetical protein